MGPLVMIYLKLCIILLSFRLVSCLTDQELARFQSRHFVEPFSKLQGYVNVQNNSKSSAFVIKSNGIPDHLTGNEIRGIKAQNYSFLIPKQPSVMLNTADGGCLPHGIIAVAINGVPIMNPFTQNCCDSGVAVTDEADICWGLIDADGKYFYSTPPFCLQKIICHSPDIIIGVALDGFPIYGPYDETGRKLTSADLDECHGTYDRRHNYRYHLTTDYPYMIGCFRGLPLPNQVSDDCACPSLSSTCPTFAEKSAMADDFQNGSTTTITRNTVLNATLHCCTSEINCDYIYNKAAILTCPMLLYLLLCCLLSCTISLRGF
ncbi:unnamed protein product [Clavelina lepadiformis]|uniref:YHYH domain-containing protein n=1 Tax=Clavelina lepadiformis TaxID=159417 RepID=A0ABP0H1B2_CLALP